LIPASCISFLQPPDHPGLFLGDRDGQAGEIPRIPNLARWHERGAHQRQFCWKWREEKPSPRSAASPEIGFDHHEAHPEFIRLVSIENIHKVLAAGREQSVVKAEIDAVDVHAMISSFCFFRLSNRACFGHLFHRDLLHPALRGHYRQMLGDMVDATYHDLRRHDHAHDHTCRIRVHARI
jgi:hypothetical protein